MKYPIKSKSTSEIKTNSKKTPFLLIALISIIIVAIAFLIAKGTYETAIDQKNSDLSEKISYKIETGESVSSISQSLIDSGLLRSENKTYFELYVRLNNLYPQFQAGTFKIAKNLTIREIAELLQNAGLPDIWITIPEGLRKDEIASIFEKEFAPLEDNAFSKAEFLNLTTDKTFIESLSIEIKDLADLEGFLFPDKYLLITNSDARLIITKMVDNFKARVPENYTYEDIIKASMLEREGKNDQDRKMISDVIDKRLNEGWTLDLDATLVYEIKDWKAEPDVTIDSPYNTYENLGYPPTPICNPGMSSINAAKNPTPNQYYFYIHDDSNVPHYAVTYSEHLKNVQTYLNK